jgi:hypothetical protein
MAKVQLNNFRFSIYIDADGTVTLTDLPPELREVVEALDPGHTWDGRGRPLSSRRAVAAQGNVAMPHTISNNAVEDHGRG